MATKKKRANDRTAKKLSKRSTAKSDKHAGKSVALRTSKAIKPSKSEQSIVKTSNAMAARKTSIIKREPRVTLITGGTGFLGSHLVRQLVEAQTNSNGESPTVLRVMAQRSPSWLERLANENSVRVEAFAGSVLNREDLKRALENVERIYHLAGMVSREPEDTHRMYELHVEGTRLLCEAANVEGARAMVLASTSGTIAVTEDGETIPDETYPPPLSIITRWAYYASKFYEERAALETFKGERLVIVNPSLLLGAGDERLSSTKIILDFLARKIPVTPKGGLNFVDARDAASAMIAAMNCGRHGERYLLGAVNWTFAEFFGRLARLSKTPAPRLSLPSSVVRFGAFSLDSLFRHWNTQPPVDAEGIEMAEYFWYCDSTRAARELGFTPRDPMVTLNDTIKYVRRNFLGSEAFA